MCLVVQNPLHGDDINTKA